MDVVAADLAISETSDRPGVGYCGTPEKELKLVNAIPGCGMGAAAIALIIELGGARLGSGA